MVVAVKRYHKIHLLDGIFLFNFFKPQVFKCVWVFLLVPVETRRGLDSLELAS